MKTEVLALWRGLLLSGLLVSASARSSTTPSAALSLKPTYGGALVTGRVNMPREDQITGVWSSLGRARLMKCAPRCQVVKAIPVQGVLMLGDDSAYRVVVGGKFRSGQKISLVLRFQQGLVMNVVAVVGR